MTRLTPSEQTLLRLLEHAGGSRCVGADARITSEVRRIANRLERKGLLTIESTQDGPRFSITAQGRGHAH
jgi:hypothetical protein